MQSLFAERDAAPNHDLYTQPVPRPQPAWLRVLSGGKSNT
jgi:hypothetical protein